MGIKVFVKMNIKSVYIFAIAIYLVSANLHQNLRNLRTKIHQYKMNPLPTDDEQNEMCRNINMEVHDTNGTTINLDELSDLPAGYNLFDMTPDNMGMILDTAPLDPNKQWHEADVNTGWKDLTNLKWIDTNTGSGSNDTADKFIIHGRTVNLGDTNNNDGAHINKIIWLIETMNDYSATNHMAAEHFSQTYRKVGKISIILCIGRWLYGSGHYRATKEEFEVHQPFDSFLDSVNDPHEFPAKYFYGLNCNFIPPRPPGPIDEKECIWAIKLGKYFTEGSVHDDIGSTAATRKCMQKVYGKRTYTLKCLYTGISQNPGFKYIKDSMDMQDCDRSVCESDGYTQEELSMLVYKRETIPMTHCVSYVHDHVSDKYKCM